MSASPQYAVELWPIDRPIPYKNNARKIGPRAIEKVAASIKEFGFRQPIVVDGDDVIIVGHARLLAARSLELAEVPVHVAPDLSPGQVAAYRLADNRTNEETTWDTDLLGPELQQLAALGVDVKLTGFDQHEIDEAMAALTACAAADDPVQPQAGPTTAKLGEVWLLGRHRVMCGSSTDAEAVARLLAPATGQLKPNLMVTDPPYGVSYDPMWRERAGLGKQRQVGTVANDDQADWTEAWRLFRGDVAYVWHAGIFAAEVATSLMAAGFKLRAQIIWAKQHFAMGRGAYHWQHEPCWEAGRIGAEVPWFGDENYEIDHESAWYGVKEGETAEFKGNRKQSTLWMVKNLNPLGGGGEAATGHGTQKPVEVMRRPIVNHTERGAAVYDPFLGSGTTLVAAELTDRICFGMELDPRYVDVIVARWEKLTGKKAQVESEALSDSVLKCAASSKPTEKPAPSPKRPKSRRSADPPTIARSSARPATKRPSSKRTSGSGTRSKITHGR